MLDIACGHPPSLSELIGRRDLGVEVIEVNPRLGHYFLKRDTEIAGNTIICMDAA